MFTGIIETMGLIKEISNQGSNRRFTVQASFIAELKVDQSVSHNGVCLTVEKISGPGYEVVAIEETLRRSNLGDLKAGDRINLERCMKIGDRLDGHFVQGHVDETAECSSIEDRQGSRLYTFRLQHPTPLIVGKGSVCVNGVSLTVVEAGADFFSVAIIPYTFEHTNFKSLATG